MHRGHPCYGIRYSYNVTIKRHIKTIPFIRYTRTHLCYYVYTNHYTLDALIATINKKGIGVSYSASLRKQLSVTELPEDERPNDKRMLREYVSYLQGLRLSEGTVKSYSVFAQAFIRFTSNKKLAEISNTDVRLFVEQQVQEKQYSISSHRQLISSLKHFGALFLESAITPEDLTRPSKSSYLPIVLSKEEVLDLLRVTKNLKHRAALALLYSSGLRIGELLSLKLNAIDLDRRQIFISNSKGRKDRVVIMAESFAPLFRNYYMTYSPQEYFIENPKGGPYSAVSVRQFLRQSCRAAKIRKRVTPHTLRHSYATHLIEDGVGLRYVQDLLGHTKPETTMIYTHVAQKHLLRIRSPLDTALQSLQEHDKESLKLPFSGNIGG